MRRRITSRPHSIRLVIALLVLALAASATAAWLTSPTPTTLTTRVASRLRVTAANPVRLAEVAPIMREAVVATEDERFYRHHGIDIVGVLRALPYDVVHFTYAQGASTITEQVAKVLYLDGNDHTPWRKLEDAAVALKLESRYTKEQILDAYLNSVYFGEGAYGVGAASEHYFAIPPHRLGLADASLLAGLIQAPSAYDPVRHPALARGRQLDVLRSLVRNGFVTDEEAAAAAARPLRLRSGAVLPAVHGIDFAPGPAFVWWELTAGLVIVLFAAVALIASRNPRFRAAHSVLAVRAVSVVVGLLGAATIVRSFRSA